MANGETANAPMSVTVTAIFTSVGLLLVELNMEQSESPHWSINRKVEKAE
jgi:hypothetical protein